MPTYCTECGEQLKPGEKFCTSCGIPVSATPARESPLVAPQQVTSPAAPPEPAPKPSEPEKSPASGPTRSIPPLYIAAVIGVLVLIGGSVLVFGGFLGEDPVVGTWSYSKAPLTIWLSFSDDKSGEIVIVDLSDGFYLDDKYTWEKIDKYPWEKIDPKRYQLFSEHYNSYFFILNNAHDQLTPDSSLSDAVLTRNPRSKPSAPSTSGTKTGPRFTSGDIISEDPFEDFMADVVLAYYPSSDEYATDILFFDDSGYYSNGELNFTNLISRKYIEQDNLKLDHIDLKSIEIR